MQDTVRIGIVASLLLLGTTMFGSAGRAVPPATHLTILAVNPHVGRAEFHVSCGPAGGDVPSPADACAALATASELVTSPEPFTCAGGLFSWWDLTISGRIRGGAFESHTSTCWTPQMRLIRTLGIAESLEAHLLPRRQEGLFGGQYRGFAPGVLRPGDLVVCDTQGRRLETGVPLLVEGGGSQTGYDGVGVTSVTLTVTRHVGGSVTAACT